MFEHTVLQTGHFVHALVVLLSPLLQMIPFFFDFADEVDHVLVQHAEAELALQLYNLVAEVFLVVTRTVHHVFPFVVEPLAQFSFERYALFDRLLLLTDGL